MKNFITKTYLKTKNFAQNNKWWTGSIVVVLVITSTVVFTRKDSSLISTVIVQKHDLREEVSVTGNVKALSDLDLSFESSGQVSRIVVSTGDKVYQGQFLASLSNTDLVAALDQAKAGLKIAEANLSTIQKGTRPEELILAKGSMDDAQNSLGAKIADAYVKSDDAIRNNLDQLFDNPRSSNVKINISLNNVQLENVINNLRYEIEGLLVDWSIKGPSLPIKNAYSNLDRIKLLLDKVSLGVNALTISSNVNQTLLDQYKTMISTSRSSIGLVYSSLNSAETIYNSAKATYDLKLSGNTSETITAQEATVEQAQANVLAAQARLNKSMIFSPISGVISNVVAKVGQTAQTGITAVSVISYGQYQVESYVPEADIAKIKLGDTATTTLDAYGSNTFFDTKVIKIDPGETVLENVPTYKVILKFVDSSDNRIKSGMTANLDILTGQKDNVLAIPSRSVYSIDNIKHVKLVDQKDPKKITEVEVETGIKGSDGYIEISSGLKQGDKIVASPNL